MAISDLWPFGEKDSEEVTILTLDDSHDKVHLFGLDPHNSEQVAEEYVHALEKVFEKSPYIVTLGTFGSDGDVEIVSASEEELEELIEDA